MRIETQCLHEGYHPGNGEPSALPIYQSTTYRYDSTEHIGKLFDLTAAGHMYSRISNPTVAAVEEKIAAMEKEHQEYKDKVMDQLDQVKFERYNNHGMGGELVVNYDDVIEIVKGGKADG